MRGERVTAKCPHVERRGDSDTSFGRGNPQKWYLVIYGERSKGGVGVKGDFYAVDLGER